MSSSQAFCLASSPSASSVSGTSPEDGSLDSLRGLSSFGLFGHQFCWADWIFSSGSDSGSVSSCVLKIWLMPVRVSWVKGCSCASSPSDATSRTQSHLFLLSSSPAMSPSLWESRTCCPKLCHPPQLGS